MIRKWLKILIHYWPWPLTLNEKYDRETRAVLRKVCAASSVCIDVGCFKGDILSAMIRYAPEARHIAFEPVPVQYQYLKEHFSSKADIYPFALGNDNGSTTFHYVKSNPTYSGLQYRQYKGEEQIEDIAVEVRRLDDVVPSTVPVHLVKIDVEGGEFDVMKGASALLQKWHPYLIFEHGLGASDRYGTTPSDLYTYLVNGLGYRITLMEDFLKGKNREGLSKHAFEKEYHQKLNCYFLAEYPDHPITKSLYQ